MISVYITQVVVGWLAVFASSSASSPGISGVFDGLIVPVISTSIHAGSERLLGPLRSVVMPPSVCLESGTGRVEKIK